MADPAKVRKHAERVRELVASVVRTQIKDPRLGMITITDARITADLREATVFYTVLGDAEEQAGTAAALESAKGMLRGVVGRALGLRHSPSLAFVSDDVQEHVKHIDDLLAEAKQRDEVVQQLAAGAAYAGEAQPYKVDEDDDEGASDDDDEDEPALRAAVQR
ncbi:MULTISPECIES: 30S ribosome-binding factor RbfA [Catellatospora]|uniref:Ribosome-binding factor A n=2 Tax=Catellatospora TaxID=53365 RepID=A0A8J3P3Z1_9ACTN|nr:MULTISPECIES: 30S ribosome-binding factor RbfA [Catellatospora]RKE09992.1 ribosome-binding factor A [Catellatospora citrea]GIF91448.1 ribosome-binding factor A [Catellatospora chokoriensis]GIG02852.1 ribosome-binding factor A [Catellatospora citrea]